MTAVGTGVVLFAGCGRSGSELPADESAFEVPHPEFRMPAATPNPSPPPGFPPDAGDGHDGAISVAVDTVVNTCLPVLNSGSTTVVVAGTPAAPAFVPGRRVLVHQVQDFSATSNDPTTVSTGIAGKWELGRIEAIAGSTLTLAAGLSMPYQTANGRTAQVCSVPEYSIVLLAAGTDLVAPPWDGESGGILALFVSSSLTLNGGQLSAREGFRGGLVEGDSGELDVATNDTEIGTGDGGGKGEGLDGRSFAREGRGNYWNAGGGGNGRAGGGGGGGGAGSGGRGGTQKEADGANPEVNGRPGSAVDFPDLRLVFGGGGGAGQRESAGDTAGDGGDGGGAVLLFAQHLLGSGVLNASGVPGENGSGASAGGGGAGGTVIVVVHGSLSATVDVDVSGGRGGNHVANDTRRGPGGGGGGGLAIVDVPAPMVISTEGSLTGVNTLFGNDPYQAEPGLPGRTLQLP